MKRSKRLFSYLTALILLLSLNETLKTEEIGLLYISKYKINNPKKLKQYLSSEINKNPETETFKFSIPINDLCSEEDANFIINSNLGIGEMPIIKNTRDIQFKISQCLPDQYIISDIFGHRRDINSYEFIIEKIENVPYIIVEFAWRGYLNMVDLTLKKNPNVINKYGKLPQNKITALYWAIFMNNSEMVKLLLKYRANPNLQYYHGLTPLHIAIKNQNIDMVKLLLEHGANPKIKNKKGQNALEYAKKLKNSNLINILENSEDYIRLLELEKINLDYYKEELNKSAAKILTEMSHDLTFFN